MLRFRWFAVAMATAVAGALTLSGCSASTQQEASGATLTIATVVPSSTFAVKDSQWANESPYLQAVYDGLLRAKPDGSVEPWLATKWSYDSTKTKLTMTLREGVTFSDGTKFTAEVAAKNLMRFKNGTSPQKGYLASLSAAKAPDEKSLTLELSAPNPSLLQFLTQNPGLMESPKNFDAPNEKTDPVGSGPYLLDTKSTVVGSTYVFTKNPKYWAPEQQHYSKLVINLLSTPTALLNAIKGGQVNGAPLSDNATTDQAKAAGYSAHSHQPNFTGLLLFDRAGAASKPLADVRVRQAINYAFDRQGLLKAVEAGYGEVTTQIFNPNTTAYDKSLNSYYTYDPEKAKTLLREAGYAPGSITLTQPQAPSIPPAAYALAQEQLKAVGINVKYVAVSQANFVPDMLAAKYPSGFLPLKAAPTVWETLTLDLLPTAAWNPYHYPDSTVKSLAEKIQKGTESEAIEAGKKLNKYIVEQAWFAPWYGSLATYVTDSKTTVEQQVGNAYPYLWNFKPKA